MYATNGIMVYDPEPSKAYSIRSQGLGEDTGFLVPYFLFFQILEKLNRSMGERGVVVLRGRTVSRMPSEESASPTLVAIPWIKCIISRCYTKGVHHQTSDNRYRNSP